MFLFMPDIQSYNFLFVISGKEQVEMFVNAIEESAKKRPVHIPVAANEITDEAELVRFMAKWGKANERAHQKKN